MESLHPQRGRNVVFHEFAHQLDMLDGTVDGTPPLDDDDFRDRWVEVCTREFRSIRDDDEHLLRDYAGADPGEFFAVATEVFFTRPVRAARAPRGAVRDAHRVLPPGPSEPLRSAEPGSGGPRVDARINIIRSSSGSVLPC